MPPSEAAISRFSRSESVNSPLIRAFELLPISLIASSAITSEKGEAFEFKNDSTAWQSASTAVFLETSSGIVRVYLESRNVE